MLPSLHRSAGKLNQKIAPLLLKYFLLIGQGGRGRARREGRGGGEKGEERRIIFESTEIFAELSKALVEEGGPAFCDSPRSSQSGNAYHYQNGLALETDSGGTDHYQSGMVLKSGMDSDHYQSRMVLKSGANSDHYQSGMVLGKSGMDEAHYQGGLGLENLSMNHYQEGLVLENTGM